MSTECCTEVPEVVFWEVDNTSSIILYLTYDCMISGLYIVFSYLSWR